MPAHGSDVPVTGGAGGRPAPHQAPPRRIADHGAVGDLNTLALIATDGTVDFLCWPCFDSPTIFAGLLDPGNGGVFELAPQIPGARSVQMYIPETNVLSTRWLGEEASAEIIDFMPTPEGADTPCPTRLIRRVTCTRGTVSVHLRCAPRFDYARVRPEVRLDHGGAIFTAPGQTALRLGGIDGLVLGDAEVSATLQLRAGEAIDIVFDEAGEAALSAAEIETTFNATVERWRKWAAQSTYRGRWRDAVSRSALVLKLLTSRRHGSIVAAATFGLPEASGGSRNWDYRATWIRDASFTIYALMRLGYQQEATAFYRWLGDRAERSNEKGQLHIMYALDGTLARPETLLPHLSGYGGAVPVRIGNGAATQRQLDIYGELLDSVYLSNKYGEAISHDGWLGVCRVVDHVCREWQTADAGIWEIRSEPRHHLHSRLMCWVAVDRALRLANKRSLAAPFEQWIEARNAIHDDIWCNFWNEEAGHFVQSKGGKDLDAALLLMPLVRFVGATDPRWTATLDAIGKHLTDDGLVYRYSAEDGLEGKEGAFAACSFWYVECLARAGRVSEAQLLFEKVLRFANHVQLYAEEFDTRANLTGNFPQAFTHLALISAAFYLDRKLDGRGNGAWQA